MGSGKGIPCPGGATAQTVDEADSESGPPQGSGEKEKAQGPGPQIIGREVINPRVNEKQERRHGEFLS